MGIKKTFVCMLGLYKIVYERRKSHVKSLKQLRSENRVKYTCEFTK